MAAIRGSGLLTTLGALATNTESLAAGSARILPAGELMVGLGQYSVIQIWDPVLSNWKIIPRSTDGVAYVDSDGVNFRLINLSGCAVGAVVTNHGTGYASATIASPTGGSKWTAIVGGMINTSQSVTSGGSGYTYAPRCVVSAPPAGGVPCTMHCTLSAGVVNALVVDNQGAGYITAPTLTFVTDPRDNPAAIVPATNQTVSITGAGQVSAVLCTDPGSPVTSVPSLTIVDPTGAGASATATAIMSFATTGYTVSNGGSFAAGTEITSTGGILTTAVSPANTNPAIEKSIIKTRPARIVPALSGNAIVASASTAPLSVDDWGFGFQLIPNAVPLDGNGLASTAVTTLAFTVGGQLDFVWVQPLRG